PWRQGLRQSLPSRPCPLHALVHRLPLGSQVGGAVRAGPLPLHTKAVGLATAGRPVSQREGQPTGWTQAQDTTPFAATTLLCAAALVQAADLRVDRRRRLRRARTGTLLCPAKPQAARPVEPGQQVLPRRQPVRAATALLWPLSPARQR